MVGIQGDLFVRDFGDGHVHLALLIGKLQRHAHGQRDMVGHLGAVHGEDQLGVAFAIRLGRGNGDGHGLARFVAHDGGFEAGDEHAFAHGEFQGFAFAGRIENSAVAESAGVVHTQGVAILDSHGYSV